MGNTFAKGSKNPCSKKKANKISKAKEKFDWYIKCPNGTIEITKSIPKFCKLKGIHQGNLYSTFTGKRNHTSHYKIIDRKLINNLKIGE